MPTIVGVRFRRAGKVYYFDPAGHDLDTSDWVVVDTSRGQEIGQIVIAPHQVVESEIKEPLKPVIRPATATDLRSLQAHRLRECNALARAREEAARHNLPMKIVGAEYSFDGTRLTFYFTAEGRVDFRNLVRDLARILKARIELRQAGVRDEAKIMDGVGICGRQLCCASFLDGFTAVSIRTAKLQGLPLNPLKISGQCGRLLCCLSFEEDIYREARARLPKPGAEIETIHGVGRVHSVNLISERITVEYAQGNIQEITLDQLGPPPEKPPVVSEPSSEPAEPQRKKRRRRRRRPQSTAADSRASASQPSPQNQKATEQARKPKTPQEGKETQPRTSRRRRRRPRRGSDKTSS